MRRLRDYYRQFEEETPEEASARLREQRDAERARALTEVPALDLASPAWHEPPHPELVNAVTYALRRSVNAYPDPEATALRDALATRHGVAPAQVVVGDGAAELLRRGLAAVVDEWRARAGSGSPRAAPEVLVAWPGWARLPSLVHEAGAVAVPVPLGGDGAADLGALAAAAGPRAAAAVLCAPNDPTGGHVRPAALAGLAAALPEWTWLLVDAALADLAPPGDDPAGIVAAGARAIVVRSASKAHAVAGLRAGYALGPAEAAPLLARMRPALGASTPAQAALGWALEHGEAAAGRRRAAAARQRERLAAALAGTPFSFPAGHGHLVWLSSAAHDGRALAGGLAAARIAVTAGAAWGDDRHVRVALRGPEATDRLAAALVELSRASRRG